MLHFERRPDEWTYALGVVVAYGFRQIVGVRSVAPFVLFNFRSGLEHLFAQTRTESCHRTAVGQRDGLVFIYTDEIVDDASISTYAGIAVFLTDVAHAVSLEQRVGEHG